MDCYACPSCCARGCVRGQAEAGGSLLGGALGLGGLNIDTWVQFAEPEVREEERHRRPWTGAATAT
jgi:hypothetical protein